MPGAFTGVNMRRDRMMTVLGFGLVTLWSTVVAQNPPQTPDTSRISQRVIEIRPRIKVEEPTVIAFAKSHADTSHVGIEAHREIAERLGFAFTVAIGERPSVLDTRYNAMQYVPEDASAGF